MYTKDTSNTHTWDYLAPINTPLIVALSVLAFTGLVSFVVEVRRRQRKKAMERYAIKRMRRKFKGAQVTAGKGKRTKAGAGIKGAGKKDDNVDWKQYYNENKK